MKTAIGYIVISICWSRFASLCLWEKDPSLLFLLSLSVYGEMTEIKMFTDINLAFSLVQTRSSVISIDSPSWFKTEIFPTLPPPPYLNRNHDCTVLYRTELWIVWTVTPLVNTVEMYTIIVFIYSFCITVILIIRLTVMKIFNAAKSGACSLHALSYFIVFYFIALVILITFIVKRIL